jgi:hypothetical protein
MFQEVAVTGETTYVPSHCNAAVNINEGEDEDKDVGNTTSGDTAAGYNTGGDTTARYSTGGDTTGTGSPQSSGSKRSFNSLLAPHSTGTSPSKKKKKNCAMSAMSAIEAGLDHIFSSRQARQ